MKQPISAEQCFLAAENILLAMGTDGTIEQINPKGALTLGSSPENLLGSSFYDLFPLDKKTEYMTQFAVAIERPDQRSHYYETKLQLPGNEQIIIGWNTSPLVYRNYKQGLLLTGQDITSRKKTETNIQRSFQIQNVFNSIIRLSLENIPLQKIFSATINQLITIPWLQLESMGAIFLNNEVKQTSESNLVNRPSKYIAQVIQKNNSRTHEMAFASDKDDFLDGQLFPEFTNNQLRIPLKTSDDKIIGSMHLYNQSNCTRGAYENDFLATVAHFLVIIIQRKQAEEQLKRAFDRIDHLMANIPSVMIVLDLHLRVTQWNKTAEHLFGQPAETAIGQPFDQKLLPIIWSDQLDNLVDTMQHKSLLHLKDIKFNQRIGKEGYLEFIITPIRETNQHLSEILIIARDITESKLMESQMLQSQKLESIGQLAAGIAHEINTPIQYVSDNISFLDSSIQDMCQIIYNFQKVGQLYEKGHLTQDHIKSLELEQQNLDLDYLIKEMPAAIKQSLDGVSRVSEIVRAMKGFAHPDRTTEMVPSDINKALEDTITVSKNEWKFLADIQTDLDSTLPTVECLIGEINQVFLNLIINAVHAIESKNGKGKIVISTRKCDDSVEIRITDNGTGIPEAIQNRIFDPFFTTKDVGKGTGQGLALSRSIINDKHHGFLTFNTRPDLGTTFIIELPICQQNPCLPRVDQPSPSM